MLVTNQTSFDIYFGPLHLAAGIGQTLTIDDTTETSLYLTNDSVADAVNNAAQSGNVTVSGEALPFPRPTGTPTLLHGDGSPEGLVFAPQGSLYMRRDGVGADSLYVKTTGVTINTGWLAYGSAVGGAGTQWDYEQITANVSVTATSQATANTVITGNTITYDGTKVKVEVFAPEISQGTSNRVLGVILRDTTVLGQWVWGTNNSNGITTLGTLFDTPSAADHTYAVKAFLDASGTGTIQAGPGGSGALMPAFLRVTKA